MAAPITSYTRKLETREAEALRQLLAERGYVLGLAPHARYTADGRAVKVVMYESGKLVVQGRGTEEFVQFLLEPEILKRAELGYEELLNPEILLPRIGVDESGKGDLFGPLCIAGVYVNETVVRQWKASGIRDSKTVGSDRKISDLAGVIQETRGCVFDVVAIGNEAYNRMFTKLGSVNRMLAWGHARVIENLMQRRGQMNPWPVRAVIDQFASTESTVNQALMTSGKELEIIQRHKAESDMAVAAASILARDAFVGRLKRLGQGLGVELPKGAGKEADAALARIVSMHGLAAMARVTKVHFRNTLRIKDVEPH